MKARLYDELSFFGGAGGSLPAQRAYRAASGLPTSAKTVHWTVFFRKSMICSLLVRLPNINKKIKARHKDELLFLVEPGGVEPPSKNLFLPASPSAVSCLNFPYIPDKKQTDILGSSYFMTAARTSYCSHLPLNDALAKSRYSLVGRPPN